MSGSNARPWVGILAPMPGIFDNQPPRRSGSGFIPHPGRVAPYPLLTDRSITAEDWAFVEDLAQIAADVLVAGNTADRDLRVLTHAVVQAGRQVPVCVGLLERLPSAYAVWRMAGNTANLAQILAGTYAFTTMADQVQQAFDADGVERWDLVESMCEANRDGSSAVQAVAALAGLYPLLMAGASIPSQGGAPVAGGPVAEPLDPRKLPDLRVKLLDWLGGEQALAITANQLEQGLGTLVPCVASPEQAAQVMLAQERDRLARARLYHVDAEMTESLIRKANRGRKQQLAPHRVPARRGFLAFGRPLVRASRVGQQIADIVAVSWGPWRADYAHAGGITPAPAPEHYTAQPYWQLDGTDGQMFVTPNSAGEADSWWITMWARTDILAPGLSWDNEAVIGAEAVLRPLQPATSDEVTHVLVAAWDFMTQGQVSRRPISEERLQPRRPADARRDRRRAPGLADSGDVHLVTLRGRIPAQPDGTRTEPVSTGRRLEYRQEIAEYDKEQCTNTHMHKDDPECLFHHHEPITIADHVRGPAGAPLRPSKASRTVYRVTDRG